MPLSNWISKCERQERVNPYHMQHMLTTATVILEHGSFVILAYQIYSSEGGLHSRVLALEQMQIQVANANRRNHDARSGEADCDARKTSEKREASGSMGSQRCEQTDQKGCVKAGDMTKREG